MTFAFICDGRPNEWGLYESQRNRRVCGVYIHPESDHTNLLWWSRDRDSLPSRIDTADVGAVRMLVTQIAESSGEWK